MRSFWSLIWQSYTVNYLLLREVLVDVFAIVGATDVNKFGGIEEKAGGNINGDGINSGRNRLGIPAAT